MSQKAWGLYLFHYLPLAACAWYLHLYTELPPLAMYLLVGVAAFAGAIILYEITLCVISGVSAYLIFRNYNCKKLGGIL